MIRLRLFAFFVFFFGVAFRRGAGFLRLFIRES
jgi:hypothetical protein